MKRMTYGHPPQIQCDESSDGDNVELAEKKKRYEDSDDNNGDTEMHNKQSEQVCILLHANEINE